MPDVHTEATRVLRRVLLAAFLLDPLCPGISNKELRFAAIKLGMSPAIFKEVIPKFQTEHPGGDPDMISVSSLDLTLVGASGTGHSFPAEFAINSLDHLCEAFARLERQHGINSPKTLAMILSECPEDPSTIKRALGFLAVHNRVERRENGFVRTRITGGGRIGDSMGRTDPMHPESTAITKAMGVVRAVLSTRVGGDQPSVPPTERFHLFLTKQGWRGLAGWWSASLEEANGLWEHYPTAATVMAGAMLEAALVAIAQPSMKAGEWKQKFLKENPQSWQLRDLIKQAEAAGTFSPDDATHARTLANLRNRIHAGRFASDGSDPFRPPSTNAHEAQLAKLSLDLLLSRILDWPPLSALE